MTWLSFFFGFIAGAVVVLLITFWALGWLLSPFTNFRGKP